MARNIKERRKKKQSSILPTKRAGDMEHRHEGRNLRENPQSVKASSGLFVRTWIIHTRHVWCVFRFFLSFSPPLRRWAPPAHPHSLQVGGHGLGRLQLPLHDGAAAPAGLRPLPPQEVPLLDLGVLFLVHQPADRRDDVKRHGVGEQERQCPLQSIRFFFFFLRTTRLRALSEQATAGRRAHAGIKTGAKKRSSGGGRERTTEPHTPTEK